VTLIVVGCFACILKAYHGLELMGVFSGFSLIKYSLLPKALHSSIRPVEKSAVNTTLPVLHVCALTLTLVEVQAVSNMDENDHAQIDNNFFIITLLKLSDSYKNGSAKDICRAIFVILK
jgi:hypothetical protein